MRDNWAIGYSHRYTVGVWVGNASGAPMWDVSGTSGAAPIWAAVMNHLHRTELSRAPTPPAGLVQGRVAFDGLEAARSEWFIKGTEQNLFAINSGAARARIDWATGRKDTLKSGFEGEINAKITSPTAGTIIALDPDIPPKAQRVSFKAEGQNLRWQIDGKAFARGREAQWLPWPGRHVVQLVDGRGTVLDEVKIEVRGAGVKAAALTPSK
jgi:penicillin-binding protein 1C